MLSSGEYVDELDEDLSWEAPPMPGGALLPGEDSAKAIVAATEANTALRSGVVT